MTTLAVVDGVMRYERNGTVAICWTTWCGLSTNHHCRLILRKKSVAQEPMSKVS